MKTYRVTAIFGEGTIQEHSKVYVVDANNKQEAVDTAEDLYPLKAAYENYVFGQGHSYSCFAMAV